jgi:hypothetical protein
MRRASAAEEDAAQLRARLDEAQKEAKDLGWQVCALQRSVSCSYQHLHLKASKTAATSISARSH